MTQSLIARVRDEVAKTGFPLELRTASLLLERGYHVAHSVYFVDRDEEKSREVDIRALRNEFFNIKDARYAVRHCLSVECKKSASRPWVVFASEPVSYDQNVSDIHGAGFDGIWFRGGHRQWDKFEKQHPWFSHPLRGRAFCEPFSSSADSNQTIQKALLGSIKALIEFKAAGFAAGRHSRSGLKNVAFYYPIVVLEGDLFVATLKKGKIEADAAEAIPVSINYRSAMYSEEERHTVMIVTEKALPDAIASMDKWHGVVAAHLQRHPSVFSVSPDQEPE